MVHQVILLLGEKATALSELLLENDSELKKRLRKRLEVGTGRTRVAESSSWFEKRVGEEKSVIHSHFCSFLRTYIFEISDIGINAPSTSLSSGIETSLSNIPNGFSTTSMIVPVKFSGKSILKIVLLPRLSDFNGLANSWLRLIPLLR